MKNKTGGSKHKRLKRVVEEKRLIYRQEDQRYAVVEKMLGSLMTLVQLTDFSPADKDKGKRTGIICGGIKKRQKILVGDLVIVSLRDFEEFKEPIPCSNDKKKYRKCDIIHKYNDQEIHEIKKTEPRIGKYLHNRGGFDNEDMEDAFADEKDDIFDMSDEEEDEYFNGNNKSSSSDEDDEEIKEKKIDIDDI